MRRDGIGTGGEVPAARVAVLLNLFTVKAQQVGADIVYLVDIVAIFFKAVNQSGADFLAFRRLEIGLEDLNQLVVAHALLLEDHPLERMQGVAEIGDTNSLNAGEVVARAAFGDVLSVQHAILNKRREQGNRRLIPVAEVANVAAFDHQPDVVADFLADLLNQPVPANIGVTFVLQHHDLHDLQQVEHRNIVQPIGAAGDREFDAADDGIIPRILQRDAAVEKGRNHHFVVENLWDPGA